MKAVQVTGSAVNGAEAGDSRLVTRVRLRNYKSIAACDVRPAPLSFLVGPNGSGKSNFLDALRFVAEALRFSLEHALRERGGIREVRRRSGGHPNHFGIRLDLQLPCEGWYAFRVGAKPRGGYGVQQEECFVAGADGKDHYRVEDGAVVASTLPNPPACVSDRLYLVAMSGLPAFRPVYDALSGTGFYNLNPEAIRSLQAPDPGDLLKRDGGNLASVLSNLDRRDKTTVEEYLAAITPGIMGVEPRAMGTRLTLDFRQEACGARQPRRVPASSIIAALSEHAETKIGPLDYAGRSSLHEHLFTAGELLRIDQLRPELEAVS